MCIEKVNFSFNSSRCLINYLINRCVGLDPKNSQAYITLATCYTNEMLREDALDCLYRWLENHERYCHLLSRGNKERNSRLTFTSLKNLFFQAVSVSNTSSDIDFNLQVCLGILFYLYEDYTKAAECFQVAVLSKPNVNLRFCSTNKNSSKLPFDSRMPYCGIN